MYVTNNEDFQETLSSVQESWQSLSTTNGCNLKKFINYFDKNKVRVLQDTMSKSLRTECGLGIPPDIFTTNVSESVNTVLKHKLDYKENELPVFISKVREVIQEQQREVERAVIGREKYQL